MKILMVNIPFGGHVNPTLPLAKELVDRGHKVSYILTEEWKERITSTGAEFIPYVGGENLRITFRNGKPEKFFQAIKVWKYAYRTILATGKEYDLLLYEFFTFTAFAAARKLGIKVARQFSTFAISKENIDAILVSKNREVKLLNCKWLRKWMTKIVCGKIKLETADMISEITDVPVDTNIVYTVREFQMKQAAFGEQYVFAGPSIGNRNADTVIPYEIMQGLIIYVSMGTLQNERLDLYKKCVQAFGNKNGIFVIMSIGNRTRIAELGPIPENIFIYSFVPQLEVLKRSTILISHGGMNSVNEGLYYENRLLVIPMDMDQYAVSERVQKLKLGYSLEKNNITAELIWEKVKQLTESTEIESNVKNMSRIMQKAGGVKVASDCLEKFVQEEP